MEIPGYPRNLLDRHHAWHAFPSGAHGLPSRSAQPGTPGSGIEFLEFHRQFIADFRSWFDQQEPPPVDPKSLEPWTEVPDELKRLPAWGRWAPDEVRIVNNPGSFGSADQVGIFIENGIHNSFLHSATADAFGDELVRDVHSSPQSTYFYQIHGLVDFWWKHWESSKGGWRPWFQIHPETVFDHGSQRVTVLARKPEQLDLFTIGFDNRVWTTFWNPEHGWNPWFQLHPETVFDHGSQRVTVLARKPEQLDLFTIGFDNRVWTTFWNPEHGWNSWFQIHPETVFDHTVQKITAVARKPDQIDLFAIGFDNAVWTTFWNPEHGWNSWFQIHPETVFDHTVQKITAVARKPDQIDLFAIGFDDRVWTTFWNPQNSWNPWFQIHPETVFDHHAQSISAVARMPDQIDLFTIGFDDRVWTTFWNPQNGWNPWFQIHRETAFDHSRQKITAVARKSEQLDLFTIGFDDRVWTTFWNPQNGWNPWFQIHPETVFDHSRQEITGLARKSEQLDLFTIGFDDRVWTAFWNPA